jgi:hypothetical protein
MTFVTLPFRRFFFHKTHEASAFSSSGSWYNELVAVKLTPSASISCRYLH